MNNFFVGKKKGFRESAGHRIAFHSLGSSPEVWV